jgi:PAS domain S-box-containing protein
MNMSIDTATLEHEIAALRQNLQDAEEVCRAIRFGEVDAIIAGPSDEEKRVLLLSGAYARYRQLVEDMQQGALTVSSSGDILFANQSFAEMLGEPLIDLFRTSIETRVTQSDREKLQLLLKPRTGQRDLELSLVRRNGECRPVRMSLVSSSDDFITLIVTDIGAQMMLEEARATLEAIRRGQVDAFVVGGREVVMLDSAQSHYRVLVERMRQGAATVSANGEIGYVNERFASMLGIPHGTLIGSSLASYVRESDRPAFQAMLDARQTAQGELKLRRGNGDTVATQAVMTAVDGQRMFLFSDLTEQKRHEASDERTRKFLGMLAHEFRNILSPISNSVQALKLSPSLSPGDRKAVELIERQGERLLALVEDLRRINPKE